MNAEQLNAGQLLARWLSEFTGTFPPAEGILRIRAAEPRFQTRNYFNRFKVETATFDGSGEHPTDIKCLVLEISVTDQSAIIATGTACDSIKDL